MSPNSQLNPLEMPKKILVNLEFAKQKCALTGCNKEHCVAPWHKPCVLAKYELAERMWPMLVLVGGLEIIIGIILTILIVMFGNDYDALYGTEESHSISRACLTASCILWITACLLFVSIHWKIRRLMLVYVFISTILGVFVFILSVIKMQYGLSLVEEESSNMSGCTRNQNFLSSPPCLLGLLTLLGSAVHFLGNIVVFTYYNLKYIQPCMVKSSDTI